MAGKAKDPKDPKDPVIKYFLAEEKEDKDGKKIKIGKWSDGFSDKSKAEKADAKADKKNKAIKDDAVNVEDGTVLLIDEVAECVSLTGNVSLFAIAGGTLTVNGVRRV